MADNSGLARQLLDAFKLINEQQLQLNHLRHRVELVEKRQDARPTPALPDGCEYPDCTPPQLEGKAEGAMSHVTRPADDDASEWEDARHRAYRKGV